MTFHLPVPPRITNDILILYVWTINLPPLSTSVFYLSMKFKLEWKPTVRTLLKNVDLVNKKRGFLTMWQIHTCTDSDPQKIADEPLSWTPIAFRRSKQSLFTNRMKFQKFFNLHIRNKYSPALLLANSFGQSLKI